MRSHRRTLLAVAAVLLAALAASAFRSSQSQPGPRVGAASPGATAGAGRDQKLRAETVVVQASPVRDTVRTTGTLAANESVNVVSELSRRLVQVKFTEGGEVEKGDLLFKLDDADLQAELVKLDVRRRAAQRNEKRARELLESDVSSPQAYDGRALELRTVDADIAALRVTLGKTEIRAPFRGRVGLRRASEGAWITPATPLTTLQDTSRMKVDFTLPERHAGAVAIGQPFHFRVASRSEDFDGSVVAIEPALDAATRSLLVRGITENGSGALVPGAFVSVEVDVAQNHPGILVPAQAIMPTASGHGVFVLRGGKAALQEVEVGLRTRDSVEVLRGLQPGETLITSNLLRLRPGASVEPATPGETAQ